MTESMSDRIRALARNGARVADIARHLEIRYQHAYKVCRDAGLLTTTTADRSIPTTASPPSRPPLTVDRLLAGGFARTGCWQVDGLRLKCSEKLPARSGVYAFGIGQEIQYVGLASRSLASRLSFYGRPGASQRTNIRLNAIVREKLAQGLAVDVYCVEPPNSDWNGFTISGPEGLEAGLIRHHHLPWNMKGTQG